MTGMTLNKRGSLRPTALAVLPLVALIVAGCGSKANNDTFDLSVTPASTGPAAQGRQILVPEPTALKAIDSNQVVVRVSPSEIQYLANSQWSDTLPRMVQSKLIAAFENSGRLGGVGKPGQGLAIDYQVVAEIRAFEVNTVGADAANVEIFVKILNDRNGTVRAQRAFQTSVPVSGSDNRDFVQALNAAFAVAGAEIVEWSLQVM